MASALDEQEAKPTIPHHYLKQANGDPLMFWRETGETCKTCSRGKIAVFSETPSTQTETVGCLRCDYQTTRRPKRAFKPMNT